ncbi:unnamed protein product [Leptidea sinapis]|uniref:Uncharacterized protein n=1 Tax=Leptidea sinapis TaxID=189913 RepID=A0A5E4Q572_9NEOP|nr:unnamed protein product [Leptidea sinapis]
MKTILAFTITALICRQVWSAPPAAGPIGTFLQTNAVGFPVIHEKQTWIFDPFVAVRRRKQFAELHGTYGEKLIERLGLGIDGFGDERLARQRIRDKGHLGGLNSLQP